MISHCYQTKAGDLIKFGGSFSDKLSSLVVNIPVPLKLYGISIGSTASCLNFCISITWDWNKWFDLNNNKVLYFVNLVIVT